MADSRLMLILMKETVWRGTIKASCILYYIAEAEAQSSRDGNSKALPLHFLL
jgi:hypothetical protein